VDDRPDAQAAADRLMKNQEAAHRDIPEQGDADVRAYDAVYNHILMMADALSDGIVKQFPGTFKAS
jgi:hypothetical protein